MDEKHVPTPDEIQKDFEEFLKSKYGGSVRLFTSEVRPTQGPGPMPQVEAFPPQPKKEFDLKFDLKPKEVKSYLDRFVIKQDEAKKALSIAVCDHYNKVREDHESANKDDKSYAKQNVVILGPTGVGKTYLVRQIANLIGVPFVKADATRFSETGYVGANVDDLIRDLVTQADGNMELAQYGIVYLDEADKLAAPKNVMGRDVTGRGVQIGLLKLMEETEVDLNSGNDMASQLQAFMEYQQKGKVGKKIINTRHILFIVSGVFNGLKDIIKKRLEVKSIGFSGNPINLDDGYEYLNRVTTQDLIDHGFEPEFIGRLPVRVVCQELLSEDLFKILKESEGSIIKQYQQAFGAYNIKAKFEDDGLRRIAEKACEEKTGARGLMTVSEQTLRDFKFELPSTTCRQFSISENVVNNPKQELEAILNKLNSDQLHDLKEDLRKIEEEFFSIHQIRIRFTNDALERIAKERSDKNLPIADVCKKLLSNYQHGLNIVKKNTGQNEFELTEEVILNPEAVLEKWIRESYQQRN